MDNHNTPIRRFFDAFAHNSDKGNVPELVACFADVFLAAGLHGAQPVRASDFARVLPKRCKMFESMGCKSTELISIQENWLDAQHAAVRTRWRLTFVRPEMEALPIEVDSTYLIDAGREPFRILMYLPHSDIMEVLKQHGVAPA